MLIAVLSLNISYLALEEGSPLIIQTAVSLHKEPKSITFDDIPSELKDIIIGLNIK